jgi:hypothetical protein
VDVDVNVHGIWYLMDTLRFSLLQIQIYFDVTTQVKESDNESDRIPGYGPTFGSLVLESDGIRCVGIRRNLEMGFDRPLLLISSFNKLVPGANFRGRSKPPTGSLWSLVGFRLLDWISWVCFQKGFLWSHCKKNELWNKIISFINLNKTLTFEKNYWSGKLNKSCELSKQVVGIYASFIFMSFFGQMFA